MHAIKQFLRRYALLLAAMLLGVYALGSALWELGNTAFYAHKAVVLPGTVTDVRQRPFESLTEALTHGNLCASDATAYQPFVTFTLPAGISINKMMPDLDCDDYTLHQAVEIITHPHDPNQAHIYKGKFLCGWSLMKLLAGLILLIPCWFKLRKKRGARKQSKKQHSPAPRKTRNEDDDFALEAPEPGPAKKRRTRKSASSGTAAPKRKKSATSGGASRSRKSSSKAS